MSKNPVIKKAQAEGYKKGFMVGIDIGIKQGEMNACKFFASKFDGLDKVQGIGPKTLELVVNHFGKEYFEEDGE